MAGTTLFFNLAANLEGHIVNGWYVERKIPTKGSTGGNFSIGYEVRNSSGARGFLKALDYSSAFERQNPAVALQFMTEAYNFECSLLEKCYGKNLHYVVKIVDRGNYSSTEGGPSLPVDYLVLEYADTSVRSIIDLSHNFDYSWALHSLHNVAVGISEMHGIRIAHQDIKPSNILVFQQENISKLGDVGRSSSMEQSATHDCLFVAGDPKYSPFEQLYGEQNSDWRVRRFGCDMFMFGNLIMTYFNNVSITTAVLNKLSPGQHYTNWGDTYQAILPYIETAFAECVEQFNHNIDDDLRNELINMIRQLCEPDIKKRGDLSRAHLGIQQYSLERYISRLDFWAKKYEYNLKKVIQ